MNQVQRRKKFLKRKKKNREKSKTLYNRTESPLEKKERKKIVQEEKREKRKTKLPKHMKKRKTKGEKKKR